MEADDGVFGVSAEEPGVDAEEVDVDVVGCLSWLPIEPRIISPTKTAAIIAMIRPVLVFFLGGAAGATAGGGVLGAAGPHCWPSQYRVLGVPDGSGYHPGGGDGGVVIVHKPYVADEFDGADS
ncbi:hypothetical protein A5769_19675 [Mycobacterium intracellulare]|nr:hypothetical protein A5769_19675 [Mycobacterium intracellulare]